MHNANGNKRVTSRDPPSALDLLNMWLSKIEHYSWTELTSDWSSRRHFWAIVFIHIC